MTPKTLFFCCTTILFWASAFISIKYLLIDYSPGSVALSRSIIAAICLTMISKKFDTKNNLKQPKAINWAILALVGFLGTGYYYLALSYGEVHVGAGISSFIISQVPLFSSLIAMIFFKQKINKLTILGLSISTIGLIFSGHSSLQSSDMGFAMFSVLTASIGAAIMFNTQKYLTPYFSSFTIIKYSMYFSCLFLSPFYLPQLVTEIINQHTLSDILYMLSLGVLSTALAYTLWSYALQKASVIKVTSFLYLTPIIATIFGVNLLGETIDRIEFTGCILLLCGAICINLRSK